MAVVAVVLGVVAGVASDRRPQVPSVDVLVVGDSFAEQSRDQFLAIAGDVGLTVDYHAGGGTALCDWHDQREALLRRSPAHLVLSFAGNALTECINPDYVRLAPAVVAAHYRQDLGEWIGAARSTGTTIHLVEPPPLRDPRIEAHAAAIRALYRSLATDVPGIAVVGTAPALGPDGAYHATLPCRLDAQACGPDGVTTVRTDDGIHLTEEGGYRYARAMAGHVTVAG